MIKLTNEQMEMLWGDWWPYSEVDLKIQTRVLDDKIARKFIEVEVNINPTTFEICYQNIEHFKNDIMVTQLLTHWECISPIYGYKSCAFIAEYRNEEVMEDAKKAVEYAKETIIKLNKYVMNFLEIKR